MGATGLKWAQQPVGHAAACRVQHVVQGRMARMVTARRVRDPAAGSHCNTHRKHQRLPLPMQPSSAASCSSAACPVHSRLLHRFFPLLQGEGGHAAEEAGQAQQAQQR